jgi:peptide/nickel transport system permease protein
LAQAILTVDEALIDTPHTGVLEDSWRRFRKSPSALIGLTIIITLAFCAIFAAVLSGHRDPLSQNLAATTLAPSLLHPAGTDKLGRDIFTRLLYGARLSVEIGFISVGIGLAIGTLIGLVAGFWGKMTDTVLKGGMDVMLAFPSILLAIAISAILDQRVSDVVKIFLAVGIVGIPVYARIARASVLQIKEMEYVEAARAVGNNTAMLLIRYVLPNIVVPLVVQATLGVGTAELDSAGLSYLGLGIQPPTPEWGSMIAEGKDFILQAWWICTLPGLVVVLTGTALSLIGDGLAQRLGERHHGIV